MYFYSGIYRSSNGHVRDVPYSRLLDSSPTNLFPSHLDPETRLNAGNPEKTRSILSVPQESSESQPKSSISDSKLAVDYFNSTVQQYNALVNSAKAQQVKFIDINLIPLL